MLLEAPVKYRLSVAQNKANSRNNQIKTEEGRRKMFLKAVKYGPIFGCVSCHRLCYDNYVISLPDDFESDIEDCHPGLFDRAIGSVKLVKSVKGRYHICLTCKKYIFKGKIPPMSHKNNLETFDTTNYEDFNLSELEQCLIARNLIFMKMHELPKSRMKGIKDRLVNVPIHEKDIIDTMKALPRTPHEAGIISVKLKRKKQYKNHHWQEYISVPKVKEALRLLKSLGHKYYQFIKESDLDQYEERCSVMHKEYCPSDDENEMAVDETSMSNEPENPKVDDPDDLTEKETEEFLTQDPVAKFQFDYDRNTCFANNVPEIDISESSEQCFSIAPGEGKIPNNILQDKDWDMRAFPVLDPTGDNNLNCQRKVKLPVQQFFQQRLFNINRRFASCPSFVFAAVQYVENKQLTGNINIAFNRGKATKAEDGGTIYTLHDPFSVLDNIKGTPRYFRKKKNEFIAKLENHGPFQIFFTLSCADSRFEENFTSLLQDHEIHYEIKDGKEKCFIDGQTLEEFLKSHQSKHEFIRKNILTATRNFDHRVKNFIKIIIMSKFNEMHVEFYNYRVEFQMRGAGHIHGVLWINFDSFQKDERNKGMENLKEAFETIGNEEILSEKEEASLTRFADKFITCTLKDPTTRDIVQDVNIHNHTKTCRKYNANNCRFNFPRFPVDRTLISVPARIKYIDESKREEMLLRAKKVLSKVRDILINTDLMKELENAYPIDMTMTNDETYLNNMLKERLIALLLKSDIADDLKVERDMNLQSNLRENKFKLDLLAQYRNILSISSAGYKVVLKRDIDEIYVNNYNKEWIKCWNANMDIQITLDHYAIITYISDYMMKDDTGTMEFIIKAIKDSGNQELRELLKIAKNTFLTHRQMGEAEAYYRLFPNFHLSGSNCTTLYIHTGFPSKKSSFLKSLSNEEASRMPREKLITLSNKPDKYYSKSVSIEDRYDGRPEVLQYMSLAQFAKRLARSKKVFAEEDDELFEKGTEVQFKEEDVQLKENDTESNNQNIDGNFIIAFDEQQRKPLQMGYKVGGTYMKVRRPLVLRFHKYKQVSEPHEYYFSQLRLYHPHTVQDMREWETDLETCKAAYEKHKASIKYVKSKVMKYQDKVEEAQSKAQEEFDSCVGDILDSAKEQEEDECANEGVHETDKFITLDLDDIGAQEKESAQTTDTFFKKIELQNEDFLSSQTQKLDQDQRLVVDLGIEFAKNVRKSQFNNTAKPTPPLLVVHGGAGCGKSFVINLMTQWQEHILRRPGDDPHQPYILKCAFTGTAASIIQGQTLHHAFSLSFGNEFFSLSDKIRDQRRSMLKNLVILVIDEFSMVKSDMLYQLDLRLKELKEVNDVPFGGVAVFLFGDLLQLRPTAARFIFEEPSNEQFQIANAIESLWDKFEVINLLKNHRQGSDKEYADVMNRMRVGRLTDDDIKLLESRVMKSDDPNLPKDAIFLSAVNDDVNRVNDGRLEAMDGNLLSITAVISNKTLKKNKPSITSAGTIKNTPLQYNLKLKVGARVMLTFNLDTSDGLTNGALGEVIGYDISTEGRIKTIYVNFDDKRIGKNKRILSPILEKRFPETNVAPIEKLEFTFSQSKKSYSVSSSALAFQFPLKLAWAITGHKIQGQTILKPQMLIVDLSKVFEAAQAYVMLSRVQESQQLIILNSLPVEKIYPSTKAMEELDKMNKKALNRRQPEVQVDIKIISINIRSLRKHFQDLVNDPETNNSDIIAIQQTCLLKDECTDIFKVNGYTPHFNSVGNGKGLCVFFNSSFYLGTVVSEEKFQISKFVSKNYDYVSVYRSSDSNRFNQKVFCSRLMEVVDKTKKTIITGDFNTTTHTKEKENVITDTLSNSGFRQMVQNPTHIGGGLIDHCYVSESIVIDCLTLRQKPVYYSDHDLVRLSIIPNTLK